MATRFVIDMFEIDKHPMRIPTCAEVADTLRRVFVPLAVECLDGVAYMPVPRCETCLYWRPSGPNYLNEGGLCDTELFIKFPLPEGEPTMVTDCNENTIHTDAGFGCTNWRKKS